MAANFAKPPGLLKRKKLKRWKVFSTIDNQIVAAVITAAGTLIVSLWSFCFLGRSVGRAAASFRAVV